jgi:hypothetical protein
VTQNFQNFELSIEPNASGGYRAQVHSSQGEPESVFEFEFSNADLKTLQTNIVQGIRDLNLRACLNSRSTEYLVQLAKICVSINLLFTHHNTR